MFVIIIILKVAKSEIGSYTREVAKERGGKERFTVLTWKSKIIKTKWIKKIMKISLAMFFLLSAFI